jgi:hypothetical protein
MLRGWIKLTTSHLSTESNQCRTPNNDFGECLNIRRCPELISILKSVPLNPASVNYLRASQCGYENSGPLVCCPIRTEVQNPNPNGNDGRGTEGTVNYGPNGPSNGPNVGGPTSPGADNVHPETSSLLPSDCGRDLSNRIVGGNITELDEFPWMALLEYRKRKCFRNPQHSQAAS